MAATGSWSSLPHKSQLTVLSLCRFAEPLSNTSVLSYLYYLLSSFDKTLPPAEIARQTGYIATTFALGQFLTGTYWGACSDRIGRKKVLMIGLSGTVVATLVVGFATKFWMLLAARFIAGLLNGNVGVLRTMISEIVVEKKHQGRAFLIMPMCFNIGVVIGPIIGGFLADPTAPDSPLAKVFGTNSTFGGRDGVQWMMDYPYALPNVISAAFLISSLLLCWTCLKETHSVLCHNYDTGIALGSMIKRFLCIIFRLKNPPAADYVPLGNLTTTAELPPSERSARVSEETLYDSNPGHNLQPDSDEASGSVRPNDENENHEEPVDSTASSLSETLTYKQIFTRNVVLTLLSFMVCPMHNASFMQLWPVFLSTPRSFSKITLPFKFSGGLGLSTSDVGFAMAVLGVAGITLQLLVFPLVQGKYGTLICYRVSLFVFPLAYCLIPYLAILPSTPGKSAGGITVWSGIVIVVLVQVVARTFALPSSVILVNNSAPTKRCLGTIHGAASSLASLSRVVGPLSASFLFGYGQEIGIVGIVWWCLACIAMGGAVFSLFIEEGDTISEKEGQANG